MGKTEDAQENFEIISNDEISADEIIIGENVFFVEPIKDPTMKNNLAFEIREAADDQNILDNAINLYSASTLGDEGSCDAASSFLDNKIISGTAAIGPSGNNRLLLLAVSYFGVAGGVGACTFNNVNMHQITTQQTTINGKIVGVEFYYLLDNEMTWKPNSYEWRVVVDGSNSTVYASPIYLENAKQETPSNSIFYVGQGDEISVSPNSPDPSKSIRVDALLTDNINDAPIPGENQISLAGGGEKVNGIGEGNTHTMCTSIKYSTETNNNSMSWSGMDENSTKILVSLEIMPEIAQNTANCFFFG